MLLSQIADLCSRSSVYQRKTLPLCILEPPGCLLGEQKSFFFLSIQTRRAVTFQHKVLKDVMSLYVQMATVQRV